MHWQGKCRTCCGTIFCFVGRLSLRFSPANKPEWRFWLVSKITIFRNHFQWVPLPAWLMKHNFFLRSLQITRIENWLISHRDFFAKCNLTLFPRFWFHPKKSLRLFMCIAGNFTIAKIYLKIIAGWLKFHLICSKAGVSISDGCLSAIWSTRKKNNFQTIPTPLSALCAANLCRTSNTAGPQVLPKWNKRKLTVDVGEHLRNARCDKQTSPSSYLSSVFRGR